MIAARSVLDPLDARLSRVRPDKVCLWRVFRRSRFVCQMRRFPSDSHNSLHENEFDVARGRTAVGSRSSAVALRYRHHRPWSVQHVCSREGPLKTILVASTTFAAAYGSRMLPMTAAVHVGVRREAIMTAAVLLVAASVMRLMFTAERRR